LVRQYFMDSKFWATSCVQGQKLCKAFTPLASTIKAVLINSAFPISGTTNGIPDVNQGFGHINLKNVLPLAAAGVTGFQTLVDEISMQEGLTLTWTVTINSATTPLRVTIAWTDKPGVVGTSKQLKNDIDLKVIGPDNKIYYGNGGTTKDSLNPVERVYIASPTVGTYSVVISIATGALTGTPYQMVSLVITAAATIVTTPVYTNPTSTPTIKCTASPLSYVGDGWCDKSGGFNTAGGCAWDGGDCCPDSCLSVTYTCGSNGYQCLDPNYQPTPKPSIRPTTPTRGYKYIIINTYIGIMLF
jgi:hypothetical protein